MQFGNQCEYKVQIENIGCDIKQYPTLSNNNLTITNNDIKDAIVTCGIVPNDLCNQKYFRRINEIRFKQFLLSLSLKEIVRNGDTYLQIDDESLKYLDASEKNIVSYYLGMIFTKLISKKVFDIKYLVHMKRFREVYGGHLSQNVGNREPDFVGMDARQRQFSLFEAKGRKQRGKSVMAEAKDQLENIRSIAGQSPCLRWHP